MDKRQKELAQASLNAEKTVLRDLERQYRRALEDVDEKIKAFAADIDRLEQAIDNAVDDKEKEILISRRRSKVYQKQYQEALQGQLDGILEKMHGDNYQTIEQYLKDCYEDAYIGTLYELQGQGVPLIMPIDQAAAVKAIQLDTKLKADLYKSLDIKALKETIRREITRGIASGMTWQQIARNIHNQSTAPKSRAKLIARTEGHRIQSAGQYNAQVDAKKRGADVLKQWSAALDGRTREHHRQLDGQIKEINEPFEIDSRRKAMFPGGFGRPEEDCNCRCRSNTRARWALEAPQTKMLGNTDEMTDKQLAPIAEKLHISVDELRKYSGQIIPLEAKDFEDFKRQYNNIWNYKNRENYAVEEQMKKPVFVPAKDKATAEKYASEMGVKYVDYSKLPLETANLLNAALNTLPKDTMPVFVGDSTTLEKYWGGKLPRSSKNYYGVTIDVFDGIHLGFDENLREGVVDLDATGYMVGISSTYKTAEKITVSKKLAQERYQERHNGHTWFFNVSGETTPFHEMGHVYINVKGLPTGFETAAAKWAAESKCDMLSNASEAWAEAWAAYHTGSNQIPDYIKKFIEAAAER